MLYLKVRFTGQENNAEEMHLRKVLEMRKLDIRLTAGKFLILPVDHPCLEEDGARQSLHNSEAEDDQV